MSIERSAAMTPCLELQGLGRSPAVLKVDLVIHPSAEEDFLLTAQIHERVLVQHKYSHKEGSVFPAA